MKSIAQHNPVRESLGRPLRLGVIGGGTGSFIGPVHRSAAVLDRRFELVAGVLSSHAERAAAQGAAIGLQAERSYATLQQMLDVEAARPDGIEALAVMTPNDRHFPDCTAALDAGLHVLCDKPMALSVPQARALAAQVQRTQRVFCVSFNYSGYPMVRQARAMVADGMLGALRIVQAEYIQGGMARAVESEPLTDKLRWKLDSARSGPSLVMGDIGSHAHHQASYVTGARVERVCADIGAVVPQRSVDDTAAVLWRFDDGARGTCVVTQAAAGAENNLRLRVVGEHGMLEWQHRQPNYLRHAPLGEAVRILGRGDANLHPAAQRATRIARGHPEGFREAFATLYADFAEAIVARRGGEADALAGWYPGVDAGLHSALFIDAALRSSRAGGTWTDCEKA
ncbi:MAG: Gfo/Idh/MocA family oxidoreductase [Rubrivivax sp.]